VRNDKYQECGDSEWQNEYKCSGNWVQRKYIERGAPTLNVTKRKCGKSFSIVPIIARMENVFCPQR
jgi:hypothetical protein